MNPAQSATNHPYRLNRQPGEVIDRSETVELTFNGTKQQGFRGDTIISALAAAGHRLFSRSYKYHRPRGLLTADYHDPGALLQVGDEPNVRGAHRLIQDGMKVSSQNTWPSLERDLKAVNQLGSRFLAPGFYYKTFMKPKALWPVYEGVLRRFVHAGTVETDTAKAHEAPQDDYDKRYAHPDVLITGGGPAGMQAALAAAETGAEVMLVDEQHQLGGHLRWADPSTAAELIRAVSGTENIEVLTDSTVAARYDDNWCAIVQRDRRPGSPERLIKCRAGAVIAANGLIERPYVFAGNDLPGVMLSTAARRLISLYAVAPGERAVVLSANATGDAAVPALRNAGVEVAHVADARSGETVVRARGGRHLKAVKLSDGRTIEADLLVTATGWTAPTFLLNMSGDRPVYSPQAARFLPGGTGDESVWAVGGLAGDGTLDQLGEHAAAVGAAAARGALARRRTHLSWTPTAGALDDAGAGEGAGPTPTQPGQDQQPSSAAVPELPVEGHPELFRSSTHGMVDFAEDVSSKDLFTAVAEGYDSAELAKRYTTATMGPTQGKVELVNSIAVIAEATGSTIAETGTTTWRPMYASVTLGALAGRRHEPIRRSSIQPWHESQAAVPLVAGQWVRPDHYGDPQAEVQAVRQGVGIIDVTPIGKLDLQGPDVPKLLNQLYINKWSKLDIGRVRYGVMCAEDGVVLDDGVTGRLGEEHYLMSTTSSGAAGVWEWVENWLQTEHSDWQVHVTPVTTAYTSINVAGRQSRRLVSRLVDDVDLRAEQFGYMRLRTGRVAGVENCILWRIGFTGELSYELHVPAGYGLHVWESLLQAGQDLGVQPFGMEAQRILRLEKGHLIVGQDTDGLTKAYSAGLDWAVKLDKDDFAGKPELAWQKESGAGSRLVALQPLDGAVVPAEASQILGPEGSIVGRITSSRHSPTLNRSICLGQLDPSLTEPSTVIDVQLPDGGTIQAQVTEGLTHVDPEGARLDNETQPEQIRAHPEPRARGPIPLGDAVRVADGWEVPSHVSTSELTLTDFSALTKVSIRASPSGAVAAELGVRFGRTGRDERGRLVIGSGPGDWVVLDEPSRQHETLQALQRLAGQVEKHASVVDLTHGRALFRLTGRLAADALSMVCGVNCAGDFTPDGAAFRSSVARVATDVIRHDIGHSEGHDDGTVTSYLLHCERSSGQYLYEALLQAGGEFGVAEGGLPDREPLL